MIAFKIVDPPRFFETEALSPYGEGESSEGHRGLLAGEPCNMIAIAAIEPKGKGQIPKPCSQYLSFVWLVLTPDVPATRTFLRLAGHNCSHV